MVQKSLVGKKWFEKVFFGQGWVQNCPYFKTMMKIQAIRRATADIKKKKDCGNKS